MNAEIQAQARDAAGQLDTFGRLKAPEQGAGEWDWFFLLDVPERRRISTYWCTGTNGPDHAVDWYGSIERWLELTRIADLPRILRSPSTRGREGAIPGLGGLGITDLIGGLVLPELDDVVPLEPPPDMDPDALVGMAEVAAMLGRSLTTVSSWHRRGQMPEPVARLKCGPIWRVDQFT